MARTWSRLALGRKMRTICRSEGAGVHMELLAQVPLNQVVGPPWWTILVATLSGAILSGVLLFVGQYFQARRDDKRQQRVFERSVRSESLERIKYAVDIGVRMLTLLDAESEGMESARDLVLEFNLGLNGALLCARAMGAQQLEDELMTISSLMQNIALTMNMGTVDRELLPESARMFASVEKHYMELKMQNRIFS